MNAALDAALGGEGSLALISGTAGIGKTTLAERICSAAREHGALVLAGRCYDLTETAPFGPWIELFSDYPSDSGLPDMPNHIAACEIDGDITSQAELFTSIHSLLAEIGAARPLVLLLDDQHWADDASLDLLRFLARQAPALPLLIIATYRADEVAPGSHLGQLLPLLAREAHPLRLNLQPLTFDELWAIVRPRYQLEPADERRLVAYLQARTEGNPFYAVELLQMLEEEAVLRAYETGWTLGDLANTGIPLLLEQIISGRLAQLRPADRQLVDIAAVLGQAPSRPLWAAVADVTEGELLELLGRPETTRLITETDDGTSARFVHALVRQVVYGQLSPARRRQWHQRAGELLAAAPQPDPDAVANHFRRAGDQRASAWLLRAGLRAERAYSWRAAAERFEHSIAMTDESAATLAQRGWLLIRIARTLRYSTPEIGIERLEEARAIARTTANRPLAAMALVQFGLLNCLHGNYRRGIAALAGGVSAFDALQPGDLERARAAEPVLSYAPGPDHGRGILAMWLTFAGSFQQALAHARSHTVEATGAERIRGEGGDASGAVAYAQAFLGNIEAARGAFAGAYVAYREQQHHTQLARTLMHELHLVVLTYETDDLAGRRHIENEAEAAWQRGSGAYAESFAGAMRMPRQFIEGNWAQLEATAISLRANSIDSMRADAVCWLCPLARAQGNSQLAWELVAECLPGGPATAPGDTNFRAARSAQRTAAELALDAGDLPTARRWLEAGDRWLAWSGALIGQAENALLWAAYQRASGDPAAATLHVEAALRLAGKPRQPLALIAAQRLAGELATAGGRYDDAAAHIESALALAEACAAAFERGLTLLALTELELARDNQGAAAVALATARDIFAKLGAQPALTRTAALAARLDIDGSPASSTTHDTQFKAPIAAVDRRLIEVLSPRELDVARLLPAGRTNQEIANLLFLSPKTVEVHVSRILSKTGLPNRTAAAALAERTGLA